MFILKKNIFKTTFFVFQVSASPVAVYQCDNCEKSYKHKKHLMAHVQAVHKRLANHSCPKCHKTFTYRQNLTQHEKNCGRETVHDCPTLHEKFALCISSNMYQIYENACICNYFHIFAFRLLKFDSLLPIINDQIYAGAHT